jgi:hypothetical protein
MILGILNLGDACKASFTFPEGGSWTDWLFIWFGLTPFLPLMVMGYFFPKISGWLMVIFSAITTVSIVTSGFVYKDNTDSNLITLTYFVIRYSLPMLIYGFSLIFWMQRVVEMLKKRMIS